MSGGYRNDPRRQVRIRRLKEGPRPPAEPPGRGKGKPRPEPPRRAPRPGPGRKPPQNGAPAES